MFKTCGLVEHQLRVCTAGASFSIAVNNCRIALCNEKLYNMHALVFSLEVSPTVSETSSQKSKYIWLRCCGRE